MAGPHRRQSQAREEFGRVPTWDKDRFTTTLYKVHISLLRELAEDVGLPVAALITQAVDNFLVDIGRIEKGKVPKIDIKQYLGSQE